MPTASESRCWPNSTLPRQASSGSINNGNDYVACRKVLLMKYAARWLFALHSQDAVRYGNLIYNTISDMAEEQDRTYSEQQGDQKEVIFFGSFISFTLILLLARLYSCRQSFKIHYENMSTFNRLLRCRRSLYQMAYRVSWDSTNG